MDSQETRTEDQLRALIGQAARFMRANSIQAVLVQGDLVDGRAYEGISFMGPTGELGDMLFVKGEEVQVPIEQVEKNLRLAGFVNEVLRPVHRLVQVVYSEGSDLLNERFDVLPGFDA